MNLADWIVLFGTLFAIVFYGIRKTKKQVHTEGYLRGNSTNKWWIIGLSIMGTQASAVTFLSATGQGMEDGMRFAQFYFGLPLAMVIVAYKIAPLYFRLKVYTAYEYLETRFDAKQERSEQFYFYAFAACRRASRSMRRRLCCPLFWTGRFF